ncbi:DUF1905 domain-containing protein [Herbiconiux moechotypicola]|nr:DUF1905 domain-containing protein [Herbiconiux moechotypicola]MCS5729117.1 DUF1905 domain-containing protein [Herbiconiux moechotypicola]
MTDAPAPPHDLDHRFTAPIGVDVKGETWSCVEMRGSAEFFGTGRSVKIEGTIDGIPFTSGFMPTGRGGHMVSVSAALRKKLGKAVGDDVELHLIRRLT